MKQLALACVVAAILPACSFYARGPNDYRDAVRNVLNGQQSSIEDCYKAAYEKDKTLGGKVVVRFDVEPKTGAISNAKVVEEATDAGPPLQQCVLSSLGGLKLDPPDQRKGEATFAWDFQK